METVRDPEALRARVRAWRAAGETVGLVPTMGGIHDGHLALVHAARAASDHVVASLFVNPTQFGPAEDFAGYPRNEERDGALIEAAGGELLYAPTVETMYPDGFQTTVHVAEVAGEAADDHELLVVLLAEPGGVGLALGEKLGDDGGDAVEVAGAVITAQTLGDFGHMYGRLKAVRIHGLDRGRVQQLAAGGLDQRRIRFRVPRITG